MPRIQAQKGRLYLLGSFPKKNGEAGNSQTRVTLQLDDTPAGRKAADKWLKKAERDLRKNKWNWSDWIRTKTANQPTNTWMEAIRSLRRKKVELGRTSPSTWQVNYWGTLKLMPLDQVVSSESIAEQLAKYKRNQYTYKKLFYLLKDIAQISKVVFPEVGLPTYTKRQAAIDVPSDDEIIEWVLGAGDDYQWYYGMMAAYGLRPHECDTCRLIFNSNGLMLVQVDMETKTGLRTVIPQEKNWVDLFNLSNRPPARYTDRQTDRNDATSVWLNHRRLKQKIKWRPYALRHAYAGRLWRNGGNELSIFDAAQLMGHSCKEHVTTYRAWIDPNKIAISALDAIERNQSKILSQLQKSLT